MVKIGDVNASMSNILIRNTDGTIPDPIGIKPFERVGIKTRYINKGVTGSMFPLDHIRCLQECDFLVAIDPDLNLEELVLTTCKPRERHRFRVMMPDTVTEEFYDRPWMIALGTKFV